MKFLTLINGLHSMQDVPTGTGSGIANGKNGKTIFVLDNGDYSTLQAAIDAASQGDILLVGAKSGGWGNITIPANMQLTIKGLQPPQAKNVIIGSVTFSPTTGANINLNEIWISNLFINTTNQQAVTFGGNVPARLRIIDCYVNSSHASSQTILANNTGANSSLYLYRNRLSAGTNTSPNPILQTSIYTRIFSCDIDYSGYAINVNGGTTEINNCVISYNTSNPVIQVQSNSLLVCGNASLIQNTGVNGSGVNFNNAANSAGAFANMTFDIATGTGKVLNGSGIVGFSDVNLVNSISGARNISVSGTITKAAYTKLT